MKKRFFSLFMAASLAFSSISFVYADDADTSTSSTENSSSAEVQTEAQQAESQTEAPTEASTEAQTEAPTEATTTAVVSEATTTISTTTTKSTKVTDTIAISLNKDDTKNLKSYVEGDGLTVSDFNWTSDDKSICSVTSAGKITGNKKGSCIVTAQASYNGTSYEYTFNIKVKTSYDETFDIKEGKTLDLYKYVDRSYEETEYDWSTSAKKVATVSKKGVVSALKDGYTIITAEIEDDGVEYKFKVNVDGESSSSSKSTSSSSSSSSRSTSSSSSSKTVSKKTSWDIYMDEDDDFDVSDILEDSPDDYDWEVKDEDIADVNEKTGKISSGEEGTAKVYASGDDDYTFTVHVSSDYSNDSVSITVDATKSLESYLDEDVDEYKFSSGRSDVVTVNNNGKITGVANGIGYVLCKHDDGAIVQVFVTVTGGSTKTTTTETKTETTTAAQAVTKAPATVAQAVSFNDISDRPWAVEAINAMAARGIIKGIGNNRFNPDANCKRCDFAIVLVNILGLNSEVATTNYSDIALGQYYYNYVGIAKKYGIESGVDGDVFHPDTMITREDIMVMTYKGLKNKGQVFNTDTSVLSKYTDADKIAPQNREAIAALINSGAVTGTSDTTLDPVSNITRAQMAVLMNNIIKFADAAL